MGRKRYRLPDGRVVYAAPKEKKPLMYHPQGYCSFGIKPSGHIKRFQPVQLRLRATLAEAQADLDAYVHRHNGYLRTKSRATRERRWIYVDAVVDNRNDNGSAG